MILVRLRQGIGFDIEYSEDICHVGVNSSDQKESVVGFHGAIIKLPFFQIYWGDMFEVCELVDD